MSGEIIQFSTFAAATKEAKEAAASEALCAGCRCSASRQTRRQAVEASSRAGDIAGHVNGNL
jgi:hypothetical protein